MTNTRTPTQNASLQVGCGLLAEILNDGGFDMQAVFAVKTVSVPWTKDSVREVLYKPIAAAMSQKQSTTELDTIEISRAFDVLCRHLAENFGIEPPHWPSDEPPLLRDE